MWDVCHRLGCSCGQRFPQRGGTLTSGGRSYNSRKDCLARNRASLRQTTPNAEPMDSQSPSFRLWEENRDMIDACLESSFVLDMFHGVLDKKTFDSYLNEDVFFLKIFSSGYSTALRWSEVDCTVPTEMMSKIQSAIKTLLQGIENELKLHEKHLHVHNPKEVCMHAATASYTTFLERIATDPCESLAVLMAAMIPCFRLYAYIGCLMRSCLGETHLKSHPYGDWIETYSQESSISCATLSEFILDSLWPHQSQDVKGMFHCILTYDRIYHYWNPERYTTEPGDYLVSIHPCAQATQTSSSCSSRFGIP